MFMTVVEESSMAKAAERLAISRPVISRTIANLEHVLGVTLLDRTAHGVEPTVFGKALLRRGIAVFDELRQGVEEIAYLTDPQAGELRIACTEVWAAGLVPAAIERLSRRLPRLRVRLEQGQHSISSTCSGSVDAKS
jgi:DNA-binding transcriptional LysR family regulator